MKFNDFCKQVKEDILKYLPEEYADSKVMIGEALKNNGVKLTGLTIIGESNVSPNIYLESYYEKSGHGEDMEWVMRQIADAYQMHQSNHLAFNSDMFTYENIKDNLFISAINAEKNTELLEQIPHELKEDLALVYRVQMHIDEDGGTGNILLHNSHLKHLGITEEQLREQAQISMRKLMPVELTNMGDVIKEMMPEGVMAEELFLPSPADDSLYVLSNRQRFHGAAYMFDEEVLSMVSEKMNGNFAVLPSSIHETLIMREQGEFDFDMLRDMVKEVNATQVSEEEQLSDSVYYYDAKAQSLSLVEDTGQSMGMEMNQ